MAVNGTHMDMIKHKKMNRYGCSYHDLKHVFYIIFLNFGLCLRERVDAFMDLASNK